MRVIKTLKKQLELATLGQLYIIVNCGYVRVSTAEVVAMSGAKFYAKS